MNKTLTEKGAVLNKQNKSLLKQALDAITNLLASSGDTEEDSTSKEALGFSINDLAATLQRELAEQINLDCRLVDIFPDDSTLVYARGYYNAAYYQVGYTLDATGVASFTSPVEVSRKVTYVVTSDQALEAVLDGSESLDVETDCTLIPLVERAVSDDGTVPIKLIAPGWGSSGYYPSEVLRRDGPALFTKGTQMFWDHQTNREENERPEGSLHNLAAVLTEDARYKDDPSNGPGLYARAKVRSDYQTPLNEIGTDIGVSIRASGKAKKGTIEGREGAIITELVAAKSVDFVTRAGAGGKVLEIFESARNQVKGDQAMAIDEKEFTKLQESLSAVTAQLAAIQGAQLRTSVRSLVETVLRDRKYDLVPLLAKESIIDGACANYPTNADGTVNALALTEAVKTKADSWAEQMLKSGEFGSIRHKHADPLANVQESDLDALLATEFTHWGLQESTAKNVLTFDEE